MSDTPTRPNAGAQPRMERLQRWIAALASVLLHAAFLAILLYAAKMTVTPPQGASSGGRVRVNFVGESGQPEPTPPAPPSPVPPQEARPATRLPTPRPTPPRKPVLEATYIEPPPEPQPEQRASQAPQVPGQRRPQAWTGRPPGLLEEDLAHDDGRSHGPANLQGSQNDMSQGEPSMEVGGYQVLYDVRSEQRLRDWRDAGITELFIPLPGTRDYMVCPLEVALRRESGACRLLDPDDPEMADIGDAREVINMHRVYRRGELVWRGPRAYR